MIRDDTARSEPIDVTLAATGAVAIGRFRCAPEHPRFGNTGPTSGWLVVFPRTPVWITHAGHDPVLADPSRAILYNRGQEYRRARVLDDGDRCEWFSFDPRAIAEALGHDDAERPFAATNAPVDARTYALQRALVERAARGGAEPLLVEEASLAILARVAKAIAPARTARSASRARHDDLVDGVRTIVAARLGEPLSLAAIARELGRSPYHVARVFRAGAGLGVHSYRVQLRLRASLERVAAGEDLTRVALDLGFSSHSHFSTAFARAFGDTPSAFRASASSKKMKAARRLDRAR